MIIDAGALQAFAGSERVPALFRRASELLMVRGACRPGRAPVVVTLELTGDFLEIGQHHAIGDEARPPMRNRGLDLSIGRHGNFLVRDQSGFSSRRYQGRKRRVAACTSTSKLTPNAASSSTPTKASS